MYTGNKRHKCWHLDQTKAQRVEKRVMNLSVWNRWKKYNQKVSKRVTDQDVIIPETKERVTLEAIRAEFNHIDDAMFQDLSIQGRKGTMIYLSTLVDPKVLQQVLLDPLNLSHGMKVGLPIDQLHPRGQWADLQLLPKLLHDIATGYTVIWFHDDETAFKIHTYSPPQRGVTPTENETTF